MRRWSPEYGRPAKRAVRHLTDQEGIRWSAEIVSHGRTSAYLNPKVHRPVVQFECLDGPKPRRYASLTKGRDALEELNEGELAALLEKSEVH